MRSGLPTSRPRPVSERALDKLQRTLDAAFREHGDYLRPLLDPAAARDVPWAGEVARVKRFLEYYTADREFRLALAAEPRATVARYGLPVDPEELRFLWDDQFHRAMLGRADWVAPHAVQRYRAWIGEKVLFRARFAGLEKNQAEAACKHLKRSDIPCMLLKN